jgi:isocitrate dehydrogenase (NAD+)
MSYVISEFLGDGIGSELSHCVHTIMQELPVEVEFKQVDLSLENRKREGKKLYDQAAEYINQTKFAVKYPTTTKSVSPNAILRKLCNFSVIHRPVVSIPGVKSNFTKSIDVDIVRIATGGTYEDPGRLIGNDSAISIRIVERKPCEEASRFAFKLAQSKKKALTSASKYTIQSVTDGLFQDVIDEMSKEFPDVTHRKELFDALLAKIIIKPEDFGVIVVLNEYGDFLSDMACGLVGSLGIGGSGNYSFNQDGSIRIAMFDPAGGTAPDIAGKNICNPTAIIFAVSLLFEAMGEKILGGQLRDATLKILVNGESTPDLGGNCSTEEFTTKVIDECLKRLET